MTAEPATDPGPGTGAGTLGTGVFLVLAGASIALLVVSVPLGIAGLVASVVAGVVAARRRTADAGLPGGPVDPSARLEGFIIDVETADVETFGHRHDQQQWSDRIESAGHDWVPATPPSEDDDLPVAHPAPRPAAHATHAADEVRRTEYEPTLHYDDDPFRPGRRDGEPDPWAERQAEAVASLGPPLLPPEAYEVPEPVLHDAEVAELDLDLAGLAPLEEELERDRLIGRLRAEHAEAAEELNVALARWHQLVGDDADPFDPEPVIRAHDPQLAFDPRHVEASPTVRTVAAFHRSTQARWRVLWASLGADDVPDPDDVEAVLATMLAGSQLAADELAELEAAEARQEAAALLARPLVLVEPSAWISTARLDQLLASLPDETESVVVERVG